MEVEQQEQQQPQLQQPVETPPSSGVEDSSQVVGVNALDADAAEERDDNCCVTVLKRKRGRPAKGAPKPTTTTILPARQKNDEEDVCFICFDGGSLVLCDRRGCPKAYHPTCIKRDEAFFRSKAKWNCGWHLCSDCGKASHYMCYTCTYSLCKECTQNADFVSVRGNKGLCGICMRTIMLIEKSAQGNKGEVDFDDKSSWEYLFKVYWMYLKEKLSLTFDEILRAKNPWRGAVRVSCKVQSPYEHYHLKVDNGSGSENSCIDIDSNNLKNKKSKRSDKQGLPTTCEPTGNMCIIKNQINPNESAINDSTNAGVVRLGASGIPADISSLLHSTGMEQPISDILNDKAWHYQDPTGKIQGPFCMSQLYKWNEDRYFPPDLRIWRIGEKQDTSILLTDALSGKCSLNASLQHNIEQQSLGASVTSENRENGQNDLSNATRSEICADDQIAEQSREQNVDDTSTQSNGKDESVRSNGWNSQSPCLTIQADGNNSEGQSGNFERREESSKYEISLQDGPHIYPSLPSTAISEKLTENPSDKLREGHGNEGNLEENGNIGSNRLSEGQSNSGQSDQKQSDSEENSGQSSGQNWRGPVVIHPPCDDVIHPPYDDVIHPPCDDVIHPPCDASSWLAALFGEPAVDESVSDLLAEVEAMESLGGGLESPTSMMKCGEELTEGSITDCLSFANGLSPMLDAGKGDALSSTGDLLLPSQSTTAVEPFQQADVPHHQKVYGEHPRSSEVEVDLTD